MSETGSRHLKWGDWFLDCGVFGTEGLCLVEGFFRGQPMFHKLSLPVIRVKYVVDEYWTVADVGNLEGIPVNSSLLGIGCGPYNDRIRWDLPDAWDTLVLDGIAGPHHLMEIDCPGGDRYICAREENLNGIPHLRVSVYARIGAYHIDQSWFLDNDGWIRPRVFSKGLSCNLDHWHHPHWRLDFALGSPEHQRVVAASEHGLTDVTTEGRVVNSWFGEKTVYHITSTQPPDVGRIERPAQVTVVPPRVDPGRGIVGPTSFSSIDGYVRKFRADEDGPWPHAPSEDISFSLHEPCVDEDIVFWSVCHLFHEAAEGAAHWHGVGPDIECRPMILANVPPECLRVVDVSGEITVKNFGVLDDDWEHGTFDERLVVNPTAPNAEVFKVVSEGDVTCELIVRLRWNKDASVNVEFTANLFDEHERVAQVANQFNVLRESSLQWTGIHLVDHHAGDPDTADASFEVRNSQQ